MLTESERELVSFGAAVASTCRGCLADHFMGARQVGVTAEELEQAVADAMCVKNSSKDIVYEAVDELLGVDHEPVPPCCSGAGSRFKELVALGASVAVNCLQNLEKHVGYAREIGIADEEIEEAIELGRMCRNEAARVLDRAGANMLKRAA